MRVLVDVDRLQREGVIGPEQAAAMRGQARETLVAFGIDALLVVGVIAVVAGTSFWLNDAAAIAVFGAVVMGAALSLLRVGEGPGSFVTNAAAAVGAAMAVIGASIRMGDIADSSWPVVVFGLGVAALGLVLVLRGGERMRFAGGFVLLVGALAHLVGLLAWEVAQGVPWLTLLYAGVVVAAVGVWIDFRLVTFLAVVPLMAALGARSFYGMGSYGLLITEPSLTLVLVGAVGVGAFLVSRMAELRWARHGAVLAMACFLGVNLCFWVGSIWGDVVGGDLWGPRWEAFLRPDGGVDWKGWEAARDAFRARTPVVPALVFSLGWAVLLLGIGVWAALGLRREALNMVAAFGGIHFYTQYFTHLDTTPAAIALAGLMAIGAAWGLWKVNRLLRAGG